jgi:two-component sensor histidine kinase
MVLNGVMRKLPAVVIWLFTICLPAKAQNAATADSVQLLMKLGSYYLYKPGEIKSDLDSADLFLDRAKQLGEKLKAPAIKNRISFLEAEIIFERGNLATARAAYLRAIDNYMRSGEMEEAAQAWIKLGDRVAYSEDSTELRGLFSYEHAIQLYSGLHDKEKEAGAAKDFGDRLYGLGRLEEAENELLHALDIYQSIGYKKLHYTYDLLAAVSDRKGNFNKALYYSLLMIKSVEATGDTTRAFFLYGRIASVYNHLKEYEKSLYWYKRSLANGGDDPALFYDINAHVVSVMIKEGKNTEALEFLRSTIENRPPVTEWDKMTAAILLGQCYSLLDKDDLAEKYDQQAVSFAEKMKVKYDELTAYKQMGDFYLSRKKYGLASVFLHKVVAIQRGIGEAEIIRDTYLEIFKADSARGDYPSAIKSYQRYKSLTDSIFTVAKAKEIARLQLQFEKDQQVHQLEEKGKLQQAELLRAGTVRNFTIAGAGLLLLFLVIGYRRYRQKQFSNRLLDTLVKEKDTLLTEKDWLLKEVHHRVKNNLHMVSCLLESQASYLENEALAAIESSQHRIYAMSLIHQKLYQSGDIKIVDMGQYIKEFIQYLVESFGEPANIRIRSKIEPSNLGISQMIPLGLILNEAVTNAFKYAFPNNREGEIFISLMKTGGNMELVVADDGPGFKQQADKSGQAQSLGIQLMKGLTRDLKGNICFDTAGGTRITVVFASDPYEFT